MFTFHFHNFKFLRVSLLLSLVILMTGILCQAQDLSLSWAKQMGGTGRGWGVSVVADKNGNVYSTGRYQLGNIDFDPGPGTAILQSTAYFSLFVQKLDFAGNFIWVKRVGGYKDVVSSGIDCDKNGNVYVTGEFEGTIDFDPGPGTCYLSSDTANTILSSFFVLKLDKDGNFLWVRQLFANYFAGGYGLNVTHDLNNNILLNGDFFGTIDFDPGPAVYNLNANNGGQFVLKLNQNGDFVWAIQSGIGYSGNYGNTMELDSYGNIFMTGFFWDTLDVDPGPAVYNLISDTTSTYYLKLDSNANFLWAGQTTNHYYTWGGIAMDSTGKMFTAGLFNDTIDIDPGPAVNNLYTDSAYAVYFLKLASDGTFLWAKQFDFNTDSGFWIYDVATDTDGNLYVEGFCRGTVDFDPGLSVYILSSAQDVPFIAKYGQEGEFLWAKQLCSYQYWGLWGQDILSFDAHNNIYSTGTLIGSCDFDPDTSSFIMTAIGSNDVFVTKFFQCPPVSSYFTAESCFSYSLNNQTYTLSGIYPQFLSSVAGCDSILNLNLTINTVNTAVAQSSITLTAMDTNLVYQWVDCDNGYAPIPGETNKTFTPTANGHYALIASSNVCSDTSSCFAITTVGIGENSKDNKIILYPNPTTGKYSINPGFNCSEIKLEIRDIYGRLVTSRNLHQSEFDKLNLDGPAGMYFVSIISKDSSLTVKLIKE